MEYKQNPLIDDFLVITNTTDRLKASEFLKNSSNDLNVFISNLIKIIKNHIFLNIL